jgi:hypothetical protein
MENSGEEILLIHHKTEAHFTVWERFKILLGKPCIVNSKIRIVGIKVIDSTSQGHVPQLFQSKSSAFIPNV